MPEKTIHSGRALKFLSLFILFVIGSTQSLLSQSPESSITWRNALSQEQEWYGTEDAIRIANNVLLYQHYTGGWPKNIDLAREINQKEKKTILKQKQSGTGSINQPTIDNDATHTEMRFLAMVFHETGKKKYKKAFIKGVDYILESQYESGGWPQYYPIRDGYWKHITFNDGAMVGVMKVLKELENGNTPYDFIDKDRISKIKISLEKGIEVILKSQIRVNGELTAWCAQHHRETLEPAKGRAYELPSISGGESVGVVRFLMTLENPSPKVIEAIHGAVKWFDKVKMTDVRVIHIKNPALHRGFDRVIGLDPVGDNPLWARFYEIETNYPIFVGRDGIVRYALSEIEHERRVGYSWLGSWAKNLLETEYPEWCEKHGMTPVI